MGESDTNNKSPSRKFHDGWAFIIYVLVFLGVNTVLFLHVENPKTLFDFLKERDFFNAASLSFVYSIVFFGFILLLSSLIPKFLIYSSIFIVPACTIYTFIATKQANNTLIWVSIGFNILYILMCIFLIVRHIELITKLLRVSSDIILKNFLLVLFIFLLTYAFFSFQVILLFQAKKSSDFLNSIRFLVFLEICWGLFVVKYFNNVFISCVVSGTIANESKTKAISNSFMALGSISLAALLVAIITTTEYMISEARREEARRRDRSLFRLILLFIGELIVSILGNIVKFANNMAMPYLAHKGTSYSDSVTESFQLIKDSKYLAVIALTGIEFVVFAFSIANLFSLSVILHAFLVNWDEKYLFYLLFALFSSTITYILLGLIPSGGLSFLYNIILDPKKVSEYDQELLEAVDRSADFVNS